MPIGYKGAERRNKNYSFKDNKLILGEEEQTYGPKTEAESKAQDTPAGQFVSETKKKTSEQGWKLENEDGSKTDVGAPGATEKTQKEDPKAYYSNFELRPNHKDKKFRNNKEEVSKLQDFLVNEGYLKGKVDGDYGPLTDDAYKRFKADQSKNLDPANAQSVKDAVKKLPGVYIKGNELDNGGQITPLLAERTNMIMPELQNVLIGNNKVRITAGNDKFHQERFEDKDRKKYSTGGRYSIHQEGNSLDFTPFEYGIKVKGKNSRQPTKEEWAQIDAMEEKLKELQKKNPGTFTFINEYRKPTAPYGHFHIEAKDPELQRALGDTHH